MSFWGHEMSLYIVVANTSHSSYAYRESIYLYSTAGQTQGSVILGPKKDHISRGILQTMIFGIPLILGLGTRMSDPSVYVVFWAPRIQNPEPQAFDSEVRDVQIIRDARTGQNVKLLVGSRGQGI